MNSASDEGEVKDDHDVIRFVTISTNVILYAL